MTPEKGNSEEANKIQLEGVGRLGGGGGVRMVNLQQGKTTGLHSYMHYDKYKIRPFCWKGIVLQVCTIKSNAVTSKAVANLTIIAVLLLIETGGIQPTFGRCNSFQKHRGNTVSNIEAIVLITKKKPEKQG